MTNEQRVSYELVPCIQSIVKEKSKKIQDEIDLYDNYVEDHIINLRRNLIEAIKDRNTYEDIVYKYEEELDDCYKRIKDLELELFGK